MTEAPRTISNPSSAHSKALCAIRDHSARLASLARLESEASGRSALDDAATQLFKAREQGCGVVVEASELAGVLERQDAVVDRFTQQLEVVGLEVQETVDQLQSHLEQTLWQSPATLQTVNLILAQAHRLAYSSFAPLELTRRQLPDVTPLPYRQPAPDVPQLQNSKLMSFAERTAKEEAVALQREMQRVREQAEKEQQQQQQQQQGPLQPSEGTLDFLMRLGWTPGQELPKNLPDGVRRDLDAMLASFGAGAPPAAPQLPPAAAAPAQALTPDPAPVRGSADAAGSGIETTTTGDASSESEPFEDEYGLILNADAVAPDSSDDDSSVEADSD